VTLSGAETNADFKKRLYSELDPVQQQLQQQQAWAQYYQQYQYYQYYYQMAYANPQPPQPKPPAGQQSGDQHKLASILDNIDLRAPTAAPSFPLPPPPERDPDEVVLEQPVAYDPKLYYVELEREKQQRAHEKLAQSENSEYILTGNFNRRTGRFERNPRPSDECQRAKWELSVGEGGGVADVTALF
jgi:hypothetical protein